MHRSLVALVLLAVGVAACAKKTQAPVAEATEQAADAASAAGGEAAAPMAAAEAAPVVAAAPSPVLAFKDLAAPESVTYDAKNDCYIVSSVNGEAGAKDNNGFISKLAPDGSVIALKWIEGGKGKVKLDAPKGTAISGDTLFVADIDTVRMFNMKNGAPKGEIKIKGATFLNDMTASADGRVFVTDSGMAFTDGKATPTGTDAVYVIGKNKKAVALSKSTDLGGPNGIAFVDGKVWVVTFLSGELYSLDAKTPGAKADAQKLTMGGLDGIVVTPNGIMVSSWELNGVMKGAAGGEFTAAMEQMPASADIGFDTKRNLILVPRMMDNTLEVYSVQ